MAYCIPKDKVMEFKKALRSGEIDPQKLADMKTSAERRKYLSKFVGESDAMSVNALFESKMLLKNQKSGYIAWAKKVAGMTPQTRNDLFTRIEKLDKVLNPAEEQAFLQDLASTKLGVGITKEEAKMISDLSNKKVEARNKISESEPIGSANRMNYGKHEALLKDYLSKLKYEAGKISLGEQPLKWVTKVPLEAISDLSRTIQTAYDNSLWGRQLISAFTNPKYTKIWAKRFGQSWKTMYKTLKGEDPMLAINSEIFSRPNALNGKYFADSDGYGLGITGEEVFASQLPAKIPILGRLFKASENAFNGGAKLVRADIADLIIKSAESAGQNVMDKKTASALGSFVTSITGRGSIGPAGKLLGKVFYAPRFYTAEINQLTAHLLDPKANSYTRKESAKNLAINLGVTALALSLAKMLDPESVDNEKKLGKVKIWGRWVDITGGKASFVNLAVKMSEKVIGYLKGEKPKYGERTALDLLESFAEGKLNIIAGVIRDVLKGEMYGGKKLTLESEIATHFTPFGYQTGAETFKDPNSVFPIGSSILEFLGLSSSSSAPYPKDWSTNPTNELIQFKQKVGDENFKKANEEFNKRFNEWVKNTTNTDSYKKLSDDAKEKLETKSKEAIKDKIFKQYKFKYKEEKKTREEKKEENEMKKMIPRVMDLFSPKQALASGENVNFTQKQRSQFDKVTSQIEKYEDVVDRRTKSGYLSPEPISVLTDKLQLLKNEKEKIIVKAKVTDAISKYYENYKAPLDEKAEVYVDLAEKYKLDPRVPAVLSLLETGGGKPYDPKTKTGMTRKNNPGNMGARLGITYDTLEQGIEAQVSALGGREGTIPVYGSEWTKTQLRTASYYKKYRDTITIDKPEGDLKVLAGIYEPDPAKAEKYAKQLQSEFDRIKIE